VYLDGEELNDATMLSLAKCTQLTLLSVSFAEAFSDAAIEHLKVIGISLLYQSPQQLFASTLRHIHIRKAADVTLEPLNSLFTCNALRHLLYLNLAECTALNDSGVDALTSWLVGVVVLL
jgi:hypothetical protein